MMAYFGYSNILAKYYSFGLKGEVFYNVPGNLVHTEESARNEKTKGLGISAGAYFRLNLSFLLKKF